MKSRKQPPTPNQMKQIHDAADKTRRRVSKMSRETDRGVFRATKETLIEQFAAERQRREQAERLCEAKDAAWEKLESDLLSALAAIEKHNKQADHYRICWQIDLDPSPLHQHDAAIRDEEKAKIMRALNVILDAVGAPQDEWPCNRISKLTEKVLAPVADALEKIQDHAANTDQILILNIAHAALTALAQCKQL